MLKCSNRISQVKQTAKNAGLCLRYGTVDNMKKTQRKQLEDCIYHPTTGLLARNKYCNPETILSDTFNFRKRELKKSPTIKYLEGILEEKLETLYPKTHKLRRYIIEHRRISLDYIRPSKGYSFIDKVKIFLR